MSKRAAQSSSGFILRPPISQAMAGEIIGQRVSDTAWLEIRRAFEAYGKRKDALEASKSSRSKGDSQSWHTRQQAATKAIEAAMSKVASAKSKHGEFMHEASENFTIENFGYSHGPEYCAQQKLDTAYMLMLDALMILERANPQEIEIPTSAHSRDILVRDIHAALDKSGIGCKPSSGYDLGQLDKVGIDDLTEFERLVIAFCIGDDKKPAAFAAWLRGVFADGENQG